MDNIVTIRFRDGRYEVVDFVLADGYPIVGMTDNGKKRNLTLEETIKIATDIVKEYDTKRAKE